jgi:hypothetical protein
MTGYCPARFAKSRLFSFAVPMAKSVRSKIAAVIAARRYRSAVCRAMRLNVAITVCVLTALGNAPPFRLRNSCRRAPVCVLTRWWRRTVGSGFGWVIPPRQMKARSRITFFWIILTGPISMITFMSNVTIRLISISSSIRAIRPMCIPTRWAMPRSSA